MNFLFRLDQTIYEFVSFITRISVNAVLNESVKHLLIKMEIFSEIYNSYGCHPTAASRHDRVLRCKVVLVRLEPKVVRKSHQVENDSGKDKLSRTISLSSKVYSHCHRDLATFCTNPKAKCLSGFSV